MKIFAKYLRPYIVSMILGPLCMIVEVIGEVLMPFFLARIINDGVGYSGEGMGVHFIAAMGVLMVCTALFMMIGGIGGAFFAIRTATGFADGLRRDIFRKIQAFSFADIDRFSTGSLVTRLTNDVTQIQNIIVMIMRMALRAPGMFIGALVMAFIMNPSLAMVIFVMIPVLVVGILVVLKISFPRFRRMQAGLDSLNATVRESVTNVRVVKSFVREDMECGKFNDANIELQESTLRAMGLMIFVMPLMQLATNATTLAVVYLGGNQIIGGVMDAGDLSAFINYVTQILSSLMFLSMIIINSTRALASAQRIREVLETEPDVDDVHAGKKDAQVLKGRVEFKDVSFRYHKNSDEWVLSHISAVVEPGKTIGIIGSTGCGKSTLVQLIPRLYDVDEGSVLVDGIDVREYSLEHLRDGVGMVLQKNELFSGTISENLLWGDPDASAQEVTEAAGCAQADGFVSSFPQGYETVLGQGGVNVSGGQKQRLCIARALLKNPRILILDDSTSAVDTATEARIRDAFDHQLKDTTKFIIAQRISTVKEADCIWVMDDGKLVGQGSHEELLKDCVPYQEIYYSQTEEEKKVSA